MKKASYIFTLTLFLISFLACNNEDSYSDLQKKEKRTIETYIANNNIRVVKTLPSDWQGNTYYYTPTELYVQIWDEGDKSVSATSRTRVGFRTLEYHLDQNKTIISDKRNAQEYPSPVMITYGDTYFVSLIGAGIYEAIGLMKNLHSKARIIVPSYLNTSNYSDSLTPIGYDIEITVIE